MKLEYRDEEKEAQLLEKFPNSPKAELIRFLTANGGKLEETISQLESYIDFRKEHGLDDLDIEVEDDEDVWEYAAKKAISFQSKSSDVSTSTNLPQLVKMYKNRGNNEDIRSLDGLRIIHILPARLDQELADHSTYSLALALYLDYKVNRDSNEKFIALIDVRGGMGYPNPPATSMIPFIKGTSSLLSTNFPERLSKAFLYNVPAVSIAVWEAVKLFLDNDTSSKIVLYSGEADSFAPPPNDKLAKFIDEELVKRIEEERFLTFT